MLIDCRIENRRGFYVFVAAAPDGDVTLAGHAYEEKDTAEAAAASVELSDVDASLRAAGRSETPDDAVLAWPDAVALQARESAEGHLQQGWTSSGSSYHLGAYWGDAEALGEKLKRVPTQDEQRSLETQIREHLDAAFFAPPAAS